MDIKKTLRYNWEFGRETVAIRVSSYRNNGNLYVGLCHKEGREWPFFRPDKTPFDIPHISGSATSH